jgi:hypothetical protein
MSIVSAKDLEFEQNLTNALGNSPHAQELKSIIMMAKKGQITDEAIDEYRKMKERELEEYRSILSEVNPSYAFEQPPVTYAFNPSKITPECIENDGVFESGQRVSVEGIDRPESGRLHDAQHSRNENVISVNEEFAVLPTERNNEIVGSIRLEVVSGFSG